MTIMQNLNLKSNFRTYVKNPIYIRFTQINLHSALVKDRVHFGKGKNLFGWLTCAATLLWPYFEKDKFVN